jgi:hypothetical protein
LSREIHIHDSSVMAENVDINRLDKILIHDWGVTAEKI